MKKSSTFPPLFSLNLHTTSLFILRIKKSLHITFMCMKIKENVFEDHKHSFQNVCTINIYFHLDVFYKGCLTIVIIFVAVWNDDEKSALLLTEISSETWKSYIKIEIGWFWLCLLWIKIFVLLIFLKFSRWLNFRMKSSVLSELF